MRRYKLQAIDRSICSIIHEVGFDVEDLDELCVLAKLDSKQLKSNSTYDLNMDSVEILVKRFELIFDARSNVVLSPWQAIDDLPYQVHTGRELAMMLAGKKPLASFLEIYPNIESEISFVPEQAFQPFVDSGRIVMRQHYSPPNPYAKSEKRKRMGWRRVLYALSGQQWRIDAYLLLLETVERSGWSEGLQRMEGKLLGYEDWQNDAFISWGKERHNVLPIVDI
jgi:hypothetical protein